MLLCLLCVIVSDRGRFWGAAAGEGKSEALIAEGITGTSAGPVLCKVSAWLAFNL